jgi:hypothetical protein
MQSLADALDVATNWVLSPQVNNCPTFAGTVAGMLLFTAACSFCEQWFVSDGLPRFIVDQMRMRDVKLSEDQSSHQWTQAIQHSFFQNLFDAFMKSRHEKFAVIGTTLYPRDAIPARFHGCNKFGRCGGQAEGADGGFIGHGPAPVPHGYAVYTPRFCFPHNGNRPGMADGDDEDQNMVDGNNKAMFEYEDFQTMVRPLIQL